MNKKLEFVIGTYAPSELMGVHRNLYRRPLLMKEKITKIMKNYMFIRTVHTGTCGP